MSAANVERTHILIEWGESGANSPHSFAASEASGRRVPCLRNLESLLFGLPYTYQYFLS